MPTPDDASPSGRGRVDAPAMIARLVEHRRALRDAIDATPAVRRSRRPAPDRWSVDEIVEHLAIVESAVVRLLRRLVSRADAGPAAPSSVATAPLDPARVLDRTHKIVATENVQPRGAMDAEAAWTALGRSRADLEALVRGVDGHELGHVTAPHALLGVLDFVQWVDFVGLHEARHAAQIRATGR